MKRLLAIFFDFYVQSSIHVSLAITALFFVFVTKNYLPINWNLAGFLFFGSVTGYNFVKYASIAKLHHRSLTKSLKSIQLFSLVCFLVFIYYLFQLPWTAVIAVVILGLLTFLYAIPLGTLGNFRSISSLKIFIVAFCWATSVVVLVVLDYKLPLRVTVFFEFLQVFLLVICLIIPFDIRDLKYDSVSLNTLPQKLGTNGVIKLGLFLMIGFLIIEISLIKSETYMPELLVFLITVAAILFSKKLSERKYFCSFWVESIPLIYLLITLSYY